MTRKELTDKERLRLISDIVSSAVSEELFDHIKDKYPDLELSLKRIMGYADNRLFDAQYILDKSGDHRIDVFVFGDEDLRGEMEFDALSRRFLAHVLLGYLEMTDPFHVQIPTNPQEALDRIFNQMDLLKKHPWNTREYHETMLNLAVAAMLGAVSTACVSNKISIPVHSARADN